MKPIFSGVFSFSQQDDDDAGGALSRLRLCIQEQLRVELNCPMDGLELFSINQNVRWEIWEKNANQIIKRSIFFISFLSPRASQQYECQFELVSFLDQLDDWDNHRVIAILHTGIRGSDNCPWNDRLLSGVDSRINLANLDLDSAPSKISLRLSAAT